MGGWVVGSLVFLTAKKGGTNGKLSVPGGQ